MQTKPQPSRYSGLLCLLGLVSLLAGLIVMILLREILLAAWGIMGLGIICLAAALVLDFRRVRGAVMGRRGVFSVGTTVMASVFVGITLVANGISVSAYHRFDTTKLSQFTLTQQTQDVLKDVDKPVKAICFFTPPDKDNVGIVIYATSLLAEYMTYTNKLSVEFVDPDVHPDRARQYGIAQYQTVVFESGDKRRLVPPLDILVTDDNGNVIGAEAEHAFTSAIMEVTGKAQKKAYFLTGHGEASINGEYALARKGLMDDLYLVDELDLLTRAEIPADAAVLIIAAPQKPLTDPEVAAIEAYLEAGGQAMILTNPNSAAQDSLNQIATKWGVTIENGTAIDKDSALNEKIDTPLVTPDRDFFTLKNLISLTTYFPGATAIMPMENPPEDAAVQPLVFTSINNSWLDKDWDPTKDPVFTEGTDIKGPVSMGVVIAAPARTANTEGKITRLVILGDSDFAAKDDFVQVNNGDLFLNSVNWLAEETSLITIHRNVLPFRRMVLGADQFNMMKWSSLAIPPLVVMIIGLIVWWYRR